MSQPDSQPSADTSAPGPRERARVRIEQSPKRIRALVAGVVAADSRAARLVWEKPYYPTYYLPTADVHAELLDTGRVEASPDRGDGQVCDLRAAGRILPGAALVYPDSALPELRGLVRIAWDGMDQWLEEDEPAYVHPRDPYKRVDILASSRHVQVVVDGVHVAESRQPRILFETSLVPRYYLPMTDVRMDLLHPSETTSHCPYKGSATWWSMDTGHGAEPDLAWTYRSPLPESQKIAGLVAFYNELVDLHLDGQLQDRPRTPFS